MSEKPTAQMNDADIILRIMRHEEEGLRMLLKNHGPKVYGWLMRYHGGTVADEVINRAAWNAWRFADSYDESKGSLGGWFLRVAQHAVLDIHKREQRHCHKSLDCHAQYDPAGENPETVEDQNHTTVDKENDRRVERQLRQIIDGLPPLQRAILLADLAEGNTVEAKTLAQRLESNVNSIHVQRSKARRRIREELTRRGFFHNGGRAK